MYDHLRGSLVSADPSGVVIECGGVGYAIRVPVSALERLPAVGQECTLLVHLHVRDDALELYGFVDAVERRLFRRLLTVAGVGPVAAMALMSQNSAENICAAVRHGDPGLLAKARGIGKKTAERVCLDLRGSIEEIEAMLSAPARERSRAASSPDDVKTTTVLALVNLGYSQQEAERAVREAAGETDDAPLSDLLKEALKRVR
jgi:Holliday junction DNA helicase RuvA